MTEPEPREWRVPESAQHGVQAQTMFRRNGCPQDTKQAREPYGLQGQGPQYGEPEQLTYGPQGPEPHGLQVRGLHWLVRAFSEAGC